MQQATLPMEQIDLRKAWKDHFNQHLIKHNLANPMMRGNQPVWLADFDEVQGDYYMVADMKCRYLWVHESELHFPTNEEYIKNFMLLCQNGVYILLDREKPDHPNYGLFSRIIRRRGK